jgi:hypothetical protein
MKLDEAKEILKDNGYLVESVFDGLYSDSVFDAIFNMPDETLKEFFKLCKQINKYGQTKKKYSYEMAIVNFGDKFTELIKKND